MDGKHSFDTINPPTFDALLEQYTTVLPNTLPELEHQRLHVIPQAIRQREPAYVSKEELVTLMSWKLSHGKFRPSLKKLVQENNDKDVKSVSEAGFRQLAGKYGSYNSADVKACLAILTKFRGVGPATASLLISVYHEDNVPFFSDELFRWANWDESSSGSKGNGKGWDRSIKYDVKEYLALYAKVQDFRQRFHEQYKRDVTALDIEKVAYVLGKQGQDLSVESGSGETTAVKKRKISADDEADVTEVASKPSNERKVRSKRKKAS